VTEEVASTLGNLCFALDVYGTGVRATTDAEAEALMDALLADPTELHARIQVIGNNDDAVMVIRLKTTRAENLVVRSTSNM
jgi:hypothetical protein